MQDRAIAAIGELQLEEKKDIELVDLYIENMFPGKDWQILLLIFEIIEDGYDLQCNYKGIDIENVRADGDGYLKYAYRKWSGRSGDVTFTTKLSLPVKKKLDCIANITFKNVLNCKTKHFNEKKYFALIRDSFKTEISKIEKDLEECFENFDKEQKVSTGLSFKIILQNKECYLRDFELIKDVIIEFGIKTKYIHSGKESKINNKISSVSGIVKDEIYGFAAPFKFSSADKPGFVSGFFHTSKNWRNYPIASDEALILELGRKYIMQNLSWVFYSHKYLMVPHSFIETDKENLKKILGLLETAFYEEKKSAKEKKKYAEDRILKIIANEKNYFNVDILFFEEDKKLGSIKINLMIEEILPSRFRTLFIDVPEIVNNRNIYKKAIVDNNEVKPLLFNFGILRDVFDNKFLDIVNKIFLGNPISKNFVFDKIMELIRKKYNDSNTKNSLYWIVLKSTMILSYLNELNLIPNNKNYTFMEIENNQKQETSFNIEKFNEFIKDNKNFLDSDCKVGIFAVGVLVRFLFDIQQRNLRNTPFESKLRGYKLNPDVIMNIYTEALDKITKYNGFYTYTDLRDFIGKNFVMKFNEIKTLSNNEVSFYFVAGLELGKEFKREKE